MTDSPIQNFYKSSNVFITGGTGFMGSILVEKILSTTETSTLYMLVRKKKDQCAQQVLDKLFENKIFEKLKIACPTFRDRVHPISGDCSVSGFGLADQDREELLAKTNVIFHMAATVRFNANLKEAYAINFNGAREIVIMAKSMKNLKALVHVSTAYSNFPRKIIEEKIYDFPYSYEGVSSVINALNDSDIEKLTPKLIGSWPNTYTFTKGLAESFIKEAGSDIPVAIFRPSIVMPTYKEPLEGWTNNLNGPVGISLGVVSGTLNVMPYHVGNNMADIIPVDSCIAGLIAAAWDVSTKFNRCQENVAVYNFVSGNDNPISWKEIMNMTAVQAKRQLTNESRGRIMVIYPSNIIMFWILMVSLHLIPALLHDIYAVFVNKKFRMLRLYKRYLNGYPLVYPFHSRTWTFTNQNVKEMWKKMDQRDRVLFPLSLAIVNWETYFERYVKGLHQISRSKTIKEPVPVGKHKRFHLLRQLLKTALVFFLCTIFMDMKIC
ncbi:unnamed protein product [Phaedon cochleariae]|uniref:Fatty acyl-CoA reductase n=1 Tax=Phaedon cochleariae TaxID=80249 RepID=A0A9P0GPY4_PHACE|nr:unnamed protein product [Phaedon cochleariae]